MKNLQKGFTTLEVLLFLLVVAIVGFTGYYVWNLQNKESKSSQASTSSTEKNTAITEEKKVSTLPEGFNEYTKEPLAFFYPSMWDIRDESGSKYIASDPAWDLHITFRTNNEPSETSYQVEFIVKPTTYTYDELFASYNKASHYTAVTTLEANGIKGTYGEVNYEGSGNFVDYLYNGKEYKFSSYTLSKDKLLDVTNTLRIK